MKNIKDLGITISYNLSWSDHIHELVNKANKVLGVIKRLLGSNSVNEFSLLYKSLVKRILDYAAPVWCPFLIKDIVSLEVTSLSFKNLVVIVANIHFLREL